MIPTITVARQSPNNHLISTYHWVSVRLIEHLFEMFDHIWMQYHFRSVHPSKINCESLLVIVLDNPSVTFETEKD